MASAQWAVVPPGGAAFSAISVISGVIILKQCSLSRGRVGVRPKTGAFILYEVFNTSTVAAGPNALPGSATSIPSPLFVTFKALRVLSPSR
jgi:hypothetical protein